MRTEDQKGDGRKSLALQACTNDEAELGLVLTMGHKPSGVPGRVRVSLHHVDGLVPEAADHLLRYMVEAFKKWPDLYKAEVEYQDFCNMFAPELRKALPSRYSLTTSRTGGAVINDSVRGSKTSFGRKSIEEILLALKAREERSSGKQGRGAESVTATAPELVISYDMEQDNLFDVLNRKNKIPGLSHAWEEDGDVVLGVVDGWTEAAFEAVKKVCRSFGYHTVLVEK